MRERLPFLDTYRTMCLAPQADFQTCSRVRTDQRTKDYVARRIAEGHSTLDAITQRRKEINATRIAA